MILFENLLILTMDGADLQYHVGLDKKTGATVWKTDRSVAWNDENVPGQMAKDGDLRKAHSTPLIATAGGKAQMLSVGAKAAGLLWLPPAWVPPFFVLSPEFHEQFIGCPAASRTDHARAALFSES